MLIWIFRWQGLCLSRKIRSFPGSERLQTIPSKPSFFRKESTSFIFHPRMLMLRYQLIWGHCPVLITHLWYQQEQLHLGQKLELDRWVPFFCRCDLAGEGEWISNRSKPSFLPCCPWERGFPRFDWDPDLFFLRMCLRLFMFFWIE